MPSGGVGGNEAHFDRIVAHQLFDSGPVGDDLRGEGGVVSAAEARPFAVSITTAASGPAIATSTLSGLLPRNPLTASDATIATTVTTVERTKLVDRPLPVTGGAGAYPRGATSAAGPIRTEVSASWMRVGRDASATSS
ncbi:hypothetical protein GCM10011610_39750 [Nocardia rhizosphaerihabitans]|uniref:Uncharacterized protein n=1 Tax=Nocardia rhizosphaerihabitans TaxID=1691570 RepID=A0ABQ2KJG8_9NOCA|nr:hypothetical protein GCM10011610_39750 [Nocardia rhizosphaerihabitans]